MTFKHKILTPKDCPVCEKIIYVFDKNGKAVALKDNGMTFWVKFNDETTGEFAICRECFSTLTQDNIDKLMSDQIYSWGNEILNYPVGNSFFKQLSWYINTAVHLRIVKWNKDKDGL